MAAELEQLVARILKVSASSVADELEFNAIPEWDSLNHVNLMLELERAYGVIIGDEDMVELFSVRAIRGFLKRQEAASGRRVA